MVQKGTIIVAPSKKEQTRSDDGSVSRRLAPPHQARDLALLCQSRSFAVPRQAHGLAPPRQTRDLALLCQARSLAVPVRPTVSPYPVRPETLPYSVRPAVSPYRVRPATLPSSVIPAVFSGNPRKGHRIPASTEHHAEGEKTLDSRLHGNDRGGRGNDRGGRGNDMEERGKGGVSQAETRP